MTHWLSVHILSGADFQSKNRTIFSFLSALMCIKIINIIRAPSVKTASPEMCEVALSQVLTSCSCQIPQPPELPVDHILTQSGTLELIYVQLKYSCAISTFQSDIFQNVERCKLKTAFFILFIFLYSYFSIFFSLVAVTMEISPLWD